MRELNFIIVILSVLALTNMAVAFLCGGLQSGVDNCRESTAGTVSFVRSEAPMRPTHVVSHAKFNQPVNTYATIGANSQLISNNRAYIGSEISTSNNQAISQSSPALRYMTAGRLPIMNQQSANRRTVYLHRSPADFRYNLPALPMRRVTTSPGVKLAARFSPNGVDPCNTKINRALKMRSRTQNVVTPVSQPSIKCGTGSIGGVTNSVALRYKTLNEPVKNIQTDIVNPRMIGWSRLPGAAINDGYYLIPGNSYTRSTYRVPNYQVRTGVRGGFVPLNYNRVVSQKIGNNYILDNYHASSGQDEPIDPVSFQQALKFSVNQHQKSFTSGGLSSSMTSEGTLLSGSEKIPIDGQVKEINKDNVEENIHEINKPIFQFHNNPSPLPTFKNMGFQPVYPKSQTFVRREPSEPVQDYGTDQDCVQNLSVELPQNNVLIPVSGNLGNIQTVPDVRSGFYGGDVAVNDGNQQYFYEVNDQNSQTLVVPSIPINEPVVHEHETTRSKKILNCECEEAK